MNRFHKETAIISIMLVFLMVFGCAPARQKANDDEVNTSGSSELTSALEILKNLKLELNLDDISTLGTASGSTGVSELLPKPADVSGHGAEIEEAIGYMHDALAQIEDPNSFEAAYLHLYLGYAYILNAVAVLQEPVSLPDLDGLVYQDADGEYQYDSTLISPGVDQILTPDEVNSDNNIAAAEMQAVLDATFMLTGESYSPPAGWTGVGVTGPSADVLSNTSDALDQLTLSVDLIGEILPDSDPAELEKLKNDLTQGVTDDLTDTLVNEWGFTLN